MTSVWKRLQRVGKNASKFQFTASYQSLTVECSRKAKWQPDKLSVVWTRRRRRKVTKPQSWQPGISNPFRGVIVWPEPEDVDITVTLYKDPRPECHFEDKEWTFIIEDVANGRRKPIAMGSINMAEYASMEFRTFDISLTLKISSKKVVSATLELQLSCILLKEGKATDPDMQSIASMMSLNDIDFLEGFNEEEFEKCLESGGRLSRSILVGGKNRPDSGSDSSSLTGSPAVKNKKKHKRSKSGDAQKYLFTGEQSRRLSTGSDVSMDRDSDKEATIHTSAAETALLDWCRKCTEGYPGVRIKNMTTSWRNGLAFCALLHHFEPSLIDFKSLDRRNGEENNKMVFDEFDRLGIPRLLDPAMLAVTSKPDKLAVMTYLFQIKTYFTTPKAPSLLNLRGSIGYLPAIREVRTRVEQFSPSSSKPEGYNPFSSDDDVVEVASPPLKTSTPESKTDSSRNQNEYKEPQLSSIKLDSEHVKDTSVASVNSSITGERSENDTQNSSPSVNEVNNINSSASVKKDYNPFEDEEEPEDLENADQNNAEEPNIENSPKGYNPFDDDDDDEIKTKTESKNEKISESTSGNSIRGYNPFEDDDDETTEEKNSDSAKKRDSYTACNPFDDDDEEEEEEEEELRTQQECDLNDLKVSLKETGYNPFDEESGDEEDISGKDSTKAPPKPPRIGLYTVDESGTFKAHSTGSSKDKRTKNSDLKAKTAEIKNHIVSNVQIEGSREELHEDQQQKSKPINLTSNLGSEKELLSDGGAEEQRILADKDEAKYNKSLSSTTNNTEGKSGALDIKETATKPAVTAGKEVSSPPEDDSPWVMRKPDSRRGSLRRSHSKKDGSSSPSRSRPTSFTRPPPLVPTYEESKAAGSPQSSTEKEDIKAVARRVLMEARKKAGASDLLPRERVEGAAAEKVGTTVENGGSVSGDASGEGHGIQGSASNNTTREGQEKPKESSTKTVISDTLGKSDKNKASPKKRPAPAPPTRNPPPPPGVSDESKKTTVGNRPTNRKLLEAKPRAGPRQVPQKKRQAPAPPTRTPPPPPPSGNANPKSPEQDTESKSPSQTAKSAIQANRKFEHCPLKVKLSKDRVKTQSPPLSPREKSQNERNNLLSNKETGQNDDSEKIRRFKDLLKEGQESEKEQELLKTTQKQWLSQQDSLDREKRNTTPSPSVSPHKKKLGHAAAAQAYAESRKMDFKNIRPVRHRRDTDPSELEDSIDSTTAISSSSSITVNENTTASPNKESSKEEEEDFQDTTEYVKQEILNLEEEQRALDKVASKLERELRDVMKYKGHEDEEERLLQEWFILVNKKNELVRRQTELSMLEKVDELERKHEMINRELRLLMAKEDWEKTDEDREQEMKLIDELVGVVNMRDQLVQVEDSQLQQLEKDEKHVQRVLDTRGFSKYDKNEQCCIQ